MTDNIEWKSLYQQEPIEQDIYFKFVCFYNVMTELYDRGLTDKRSPYDKTEAYITGETRKYSDWYSRKLFDCVAEYIRDKTKSPFDITRWKKQQNTRYSAQGWINMFESLRDNKDEIILEMIENVGRYDTKCFDVLNELIK